MRNTSNETGRPEREITLTASYLDSDLDICEKIANVAGVSPSNVHLLPQALQQMKEIRRDHLERVMVVLKYFVTTGYFHTPEKS